MRKEGDVGIPAALAGEGSQPTQLRPYAVGWIEPGKNLHGPATVQVAEPRLQLLRTTEETNRCDTVVIDPPPTCLPDAAANPSRCQHPGVNFDSHENALFLGNEAPQGNVRAPSRLPL